MQININVFYYAGGKLGEPVQIYNCSLNTPCFTYAFASIAITYIFQHGLYILNGEMLAKN